MTQVWAGSTDLVWMLRAIGGWHVGCEIEREHIVGVQHAIDQGWLTKRIHYAPIIPEGAEAWELTDSGLEQLRRWDERSAGGADQMRNWYRNSAKKHAPSPVGQPAADK